MNLDVPVYLGSSPSTHWNGLREMGPVLLGLRDSAWARRCEGRGGGVCGVAAGRGLVDPLSLLKVRALWMVALRLVLLLGCGCWC